MAEHSPAAVTLLFTDIEGSTNLLRHLGPHSYWNVLSAHRHIIRSILQKHGGREVDTQGDSFFASFDSPTEGATAAVEMQQNLDSFSWEDNVDVRVRMGLHTGRPFEVDEGYVGIDVHRAARLAHAAFGGQILVSEETAGLIKNELSIKADLSDLGIHRLKDIPSPERIYQLLIGGLRSKFPPPKTLDTYPNNLPVQTTPLIGRTFELDRLRELITEPSVRLITILGPGGVGKTHLSLALAEALHHESQGDNREEPLLFPDGVFFVALDSVEDAEGVYSAIGKALISDFSQVSDSRDAVRELLAQKQKLLVLDNCDHVAKNAAVFADLLAAAPRVCILATSRQRLKLRVETVFLLEGLSSASSSGSESTRFDKEEMCESIELFLHAGKRSCPAFDPDGEDWRWMSKICRQLDGIPLGIELAAGWLAVLSPKEIAIEIRNSMDFLDTEQRDMAGDQASLRAAFDATWNLLQAGERESLMKLSVFRGGFTRDAARFVADADISTLLHLIDKSIVKHDLVSRRFEVHEVLRSFAEKNLLYSSQAYEIGERHMEYFGTFLEQFGNQIQGDRQVEALEDLKKEFRNVNQAWQWAGDNLKWSAFDRMMDAVYFFCESSSRYRDGERLFRKVRDLSSPTGSTAVISTWGRSLLPWYDLYTEGKGRLEAADEARIRDQANLCLTAAQANGDSRLMAYSDVLIGALADDNQEFDEAISRYTRALQTWHSINDRYWVRFRLGICLRKAGRYQEALLEFQNSLECGQQEDDFIKASWSHINIGETYLVSKKAVGLSTLNILENHWRQANVGFRRVGSNSGIVWTNANLALISFLRGKHEEASTLAKENLHRASDYSTKAYGKREAHGILAAICSVKKEVERAVGHLRSWLLTDPDFEASMKSVAMCRPLMMLLTLAAAAQILSEKDEDELAVELLSAATGHPMNQIKLESSLPEMPGAIAKLRSKLGTRKFDYHWQQGRKQTINSMITKLHVFV